MIGRIAVIAEDKKGLYIEFPEPVNFKLNEPVSVSKKRPGRTLPQNNFYWAFLTWCIVNGLRDHGHFSTDALHEDIKAWIKETHGLDFKPDFSTADLNVAEFRFFFDLVAFELMNEFFGLDTAPFFKDYEEFKAYQEYEPEATFREFIENRKREQQK